MVAGNFTGHLDPIRVKMAAHAATLTPDYDLDVETALAFFRVPAGSPLSDGDRAVADLFLANYARDLVARRRVLARERADERGGRSRSGPRRSGRSPRRRRDRRPSAPAAAGAGREDAVGRIREGSPGLSPVAGTRGRERREADKAAAAKLFAEQAAQARADREAAQAEQIRDAQALPAIGQPAEAYPVSG